MAKSSGFQTWSQVDARLRRATRKLRHNGDMVSITTDMPLITVVITIALELVLDLPRQYNQFRCGATGDSGLRDLAPEDGRYQGGTVAYGTVNYSADRRLDAAEAVRWVMDLVLAWQLDVGSVNIDFDSLDRSSPLYVGLG